MASVTLDQVTKAYFSGVFAVSGIDLEIADGEFVVLVGPSGCGKSTTLRMIAGLENVTSGTIAIGDRVVNALPPRERDIAMVFQNYALYPHLTVFENMAFGLRLRKTPRDEVERWVKEAAQILNLDTVLDRLPRTLSGGQRQRVAMGRAIVRHPSAFLFDEPLSNLDAELRLQMRSEIKRMHQTVGATMIYVTHDQVEAMTLADRVVVMRDGHVQQIAPPQEVYRNPANRFVAGFIGSPGMNFLPAAISNHDDVAIELADGVRLALPEPLAARCEPHRGRRVILGIRPEHLSLSAESNHGPVAIAPAMVTLVEPLGADAIVHVTIAGAEVLCKAMTDVLPKAGDAVDIRFWLQHLKLFDCETGKALLAQ